MNPIFQALSQGFDEESIIKHLLKSYPKLAPMIRKAKKSGYSEKKILDHISQQMQRQTNEAYDASSNIQKRNKQRNAQVQSELVKQGLKLGTVAFGTAYLSQMAPRMLSQLAPNLSRYASDMPPQIQKLLGSEVSGGMAEGLGSASPITAATSPSIFEKISQGINLEGMSKTRKGLLTKLLEQLKGMESEGKTTSDPDMRNLITRIRGIASESPGVAIEETERFEEEYGNEETIQLGGPEETITETIEEKPLQVPTIKAPKIEKGSEVITPSGGIGKIEDLPGKTAKIKSGDKIEVVLTEDLQNSPITQDELAQLYEDLLRGIESYTGQEVSRNVNLAGYDADNNELTYTPHSGDTYVYDNIPQDIVDELLSLMPRKTTGENYIGAWEEGTESPIGAAISALIQRLIKERGRGKEYTRKYKSIYDAMKPAKEALKAKKKREKSAKRKK